MIMRLSGEDYKFIPHTSQTILEPPLVFGVRMSMLQYEEYLGICGIIPKRTDYPEWENHGRWSQRMCEDTHRYGQKAAFDGYTHDDIVNFTMQFITRKPGSMIRVVIDDENYVYLGLTPRSSNLAHANESPCHVEFHYHNMMRLDADLMERLQRILYRVPISDVGLTPEEQDVVNGIRSGKLDKLPSYYFIYRPADIFVIT